MNRSIGRALAAVVCAGLLTGAGAAEAETAEITVEPVEGISADFIRGMDASSVLAEERSGVVYYDFEGRERDVFETMAEAGVNWIRLRVWNDPFDAGGRGYGGGNCDISTAETLGLRATACAQRVLVDFHYSDFWADPKRQHAPKAWEGMGLEEKSDALYAFTRESLERLLTAGVDVGMVQIGNEINNGMAGETDAAAVLELLRSGSRAVRDTAAAFDREIGVAVHFTDIHDGNRIYSLVANLAKGELDYDIVALSYYPYWHGTLAHLKNVIGDLRRNYGKDVIIAETAYCYTDQEGDGTGNSVSGRGDLAEGYPASVQGQAMAVRDVCAAAREAGALGVFYWEGTWIPVGPPEADNTPIWEEFGSGWASSYAGEYDPEDAGLYYGGCSWENQALFDFTGHPLPSLRVFGYLAAGARAPLAVLSVEEPELRLSVGETLELPEELEVVYNDRSRRMEPVSWEAAPDTAEEGKYTVAGALPDGTAVTAHVTVELVNLVQNPSFEDSDRSMWQVDWSGGANPTDYQQKKEDAHSGVTAFHFWSGSGDMDFSIAQSFTDLKPGRYRVSVFAQGGDMAKDVELRLFARTGAGEESVPFEMTGWARWQEPTLEIVVTDGSLTIGAHLRCNVKSWGTLDDFTLTYLGQ